MQRLALFYIREDTDLIRTIEVVGWTMNDFIPILIQYCEEILPRYEIDTFHEYYNESRCKELLDDYFPSMLGRHITPSSIKKFINKIYDSKVHQQLNLATSSNATLTTNTLAVRLYDHFRYFCYLDLYYVKDR